MVSFLLATAVVQASDLNLAGGVGIDQRSDLVGLFSQINATRVGETTPKAGWSSTRAVEPGMVNRGFCFVASLMGIGLDRLESVEITYDGVYWMPASYVFGEGYVHTILFNDTQTYAKKEITTTEGEGRRRKSKKKVEEGVMLVPGLRPGARAMAWRVKDKGQHNKLMFVFIPINWSSTQTTNVGYGIMVYPAPNGIETMSDADSISYLSGFEPAIATQDKAMRDRLMTAGDIPVSTARGSNTGYSMSADEPKAIVCITFGQGKRPQKFYYNAKELKKFREKCNVAISRNNDIIAFAVVRVLRVDYMEINVQPDERGGYIDFIKGDNIILAG